MSEDKKKDFMQYLHSLGDSIQLIVDSRRSLEESLGAMVEIISNVITFFQELEEKETYWRELFANDHDCLRQIDRLLEMKGELLKLGEYSETVYRNLIAQRAAIGTIH